MASSDSLLYWENFFNQKELQKYSHSSDQQYMLLEMADTELLQTLLLCCRAR